MTKPHQQYEVSIIPPILYTEKIKFKETKKSETASYIVKVRDIYRSF